MRAALPVDEEARLACLAAYDILDTPSESEFDDLARLASTICATPVSLISLVDEARQWIKSSVGLNVQETPRDIAFCAHAILEEDVFVVPDTHKDVRFAENALVTGSPHIRFYAGAPLIAPSGHALGALCVIDNAPRNLSPQQIEALRVLSQQVVMRFEMRTAVRRLKEALQATEVANRRFQVAAEAGGVGVWEGDLASRSLIWDDKMMQFYGVAPSDFKGTYDDWKQRLHPDDAAKAESELHAALQSDANLSSEFRVQLSGGEIRYLKARAAIIRNESGEPIRLIGVNYDITESKLAEQHLEMMRELLEQQITLANEQAVVLEYQKNDLENANRKLMELAVKDGLTGLYNHRAFQERLADEFKRLERSGAPLSVILLDVDKFKLYNDTFGHPAGDVVLKSVAQALTGASRNVDYVCRYGGEEFVILLMDTDAEEAMQAAERFRKVIEAHPWSLAPVTASFGISTAREETANPQQLIDEADKALYFSKRNGRNRTSHFLFGGDLAQEGGETVQETPPSAGSNLGFAA